AGGEPMDETLDLVEAGDHASAPAMSDADATAQGEEDRQQGDDAEHDDRTPDGERSVVPFSEALSRLDQHPGHLVRDRNVALRAVADHPPFVRHRGAAGVARLIDRTLRRDRS